MADAILTLKHCSKCNSDKSSDLFPSDRNVCKKCRALQKAISRRNQPPELKYKYAQKVKEYALKNSEKIKEWKREYAKENALKAAEYQKIYYSANCEEIKQRSVSWRINNIEKKRLNNKLWALNNKYKAQHSASKSKSKRRLNPEFRISESISTQIRLAIFCGKNNRKWQDLVGYNIDDLKSHLLSKLQNGMTFENYGKVWHIDHIRPVILFIREGMDVKKCWALSNLQPLLVFENLSKGSKFNENIRQG